MTLKQRLQRQLRTVRGISEAMLAVFDTPERWTHQVHNKANHALWFLGHIGTVDDFLIGQLAPQHSSVPDGYREKFGMASSPTPDPADYPPIEQVREFYRERREALLGILAELDQEDLAKPVPKGGPEFIIDVASTFETAVWHEALHLGQVTVARRHLGHPPLAGG